MRGPRVAVTGQNGGSERSESAQCSVVTILPGIRGLWKSTRCRERSDDCYCGFDTKRSVSQINAQVTLLCLISSRPPTHPQENPHAASDHLAQPS
jgi:hypothetical protein